MQNKAKEAVEEALLDAMKYIDAATYIIYNNGEDEEEYSEEYNELKQAKALIKKALNRSFDRCARNK
jgi:hypothetical protein